MDACTMAYHTHIMYSTSTDPQETVSSSSNKSTGLGTPGLFLILLLPSAEHPLQTFVLWLPHWMEVQKVGHTVLHFITLCISHCVELYCICMYVCTYSTYTNIVRTYICYTTLYQQ